jgi:hypothetical protein
METEVTEHREEDPDQPQDTESNLTEPSQQHRHGDQSHQKWKALPQDIVDGVAAQAAGREVRNAGWSCHGV